MRDSRQFCLCLIESNPRFQSFNYLMTVFSDLAYFTAQVNRYTDVRHKLQPRHHPDHCVALATQSDLLVDNIWIGAKSLRPEFLIEDGHFRATALVLPGDKCATQQRRYTDDRSEVC